jgi:alpha-N-arabinofuranosidase
MANIAQIVNVLQSVILTEGKDIVLTPTYHVFEMYKVHHDSELLDWSGQIGTCRCGGREIPAGSITASRKDGVVSITVSNLDHTMPQGVEIELRDASVAGDVNARVLTSGHYDDCNTFEDPTRVTPQPLPVTLGQDQILRFELPKSSVAVVSVQ